MKQVKNCQELKTKMITQVKLIKNMILSWADDASGAYLPF